MRVVFAGTPEVALPALDAIVASDHELVGVVTRPDAPSGRGRKLVASPVAQRGEELGVPVLKPEHPREPEFQAALRALRPDCCPVVAYGALLPQSALDIPEHGWVNLHFSCLPAWRGAAPVQHSIWAGDEVTGATTFRIVKAMDAGPDLRGDDRADPRHRHCGRPAGPARRGRGRAAGADARRHRGRVAGAPRAARGRRLDGAEDPRRRRAHRLERARRRRRPSHPGLHALPGRLVALRGRADQDRPGDPGRRQPAARGRSLWARTTWSSAPAPRRSAWAR